MEKMEGLGIGKVSLIDACVCVPTGNAIAFMGLRYESDNHMLQRVNTNVLVFSSQL